MQDNDEPTQKKVLLPEETGEHWALYRTEVLNMIPGFIHTMGLPKPLRYTGPEGRTPGKKEIRRALMRDGRLHAKVYRKVRREFRRGVRKGKVYRDNVGGFLNRVTQRATWKLATSRAKVYRGRLLPRRSGRDVVESIADPSESVEELLANHEARARLGRALARLPAEDRELMEAKVQRGLYEALALARGTTVGALKTRAHRVFKKLRQDVLGDDAPRLEQRP